MRSRDTINVSAVIVIVGFPSCSLLSRLEPTIVPFRLAQVDVKLDFSKNGEERIRSKFRSDGEKVWMGVDGCIAVAVVIKRSEAGIGRRCTRARITCAS